MPKYRQLHTKTIDSFDFNDMPDDFTRVTWLLLPLILDSEGRGIYSMSWIKSKMYPLRDDVIVDNLCKSFKWFVNRGMIVIYEVSGRKYFYIPTWKEYQSGTDKEAKSFLPTPELLRSNSGVTPPQYNTDSDSKATTVPTKNLATLYTENIGEVHGKYLADAIELAEKEYPNEWFEPAIIEAVKNNVRKWSYIKAILDDWKANGMKIKSIKQSIPEQKYEPRPDGKGDYIRDEQGRVILFEVKP